MFNRLKFLLIYILLKKEVNTMAMVCATLIIKDKITFGEVPPTLKEKVREILVDLDCEHLITE